MQVQEINDLAIKVSVLKQTKEELEAETKKISKELDQAEQRLSEVLLEQDKTSWEVVGVGDFSIRISTNWSAENKEALVEYFKQSNPGMLSVNAMTLKAWANAEYQNNPAWDYKSIGLADPYEKKKITFRRSK